MRRARLALAAFLITVPARAEQLPFRVYSTTDGLPSSYVLRITRDSRGLLWFATRDGLARFDGARFVNYGPELGLPEPTINHLLETRAGVYWVATNGDGVYRIASDARLEDVAAKRPGLTAYPLGGGYADRVNVLYEDAAGRIWAGTDGGVFVRDGDGVDGAFRSVRLPSIGSSSAPVGVRTFAEDAQGVLWAGALGGLYRRRPDGTFVHHPLAGGFEESSVRGLARDGGGRMWAAVARGLFAFVPGPDPPDAAEAARLFHDAPEQILPDGAPAVLPRRAGEASWYHREGGASRVAWAVSVTSDGHVWAAFDGALRELADGRWRTYTAANGLSGDTANAFAEDRDGNLWIAGRSVGATKLTRGGFTRYDAGDGLPPSEVHSFFEDASGALVVVSGQWRLSRFDGARFTSVQPQGPRSTIAWASGAAWLDRAGGWWLLSRGGLARMPRTARLEELEGRRADVVYGPHNGLAHPTVTRVFEDRAGDLWVSGRSSLAVGLARWERATGRWHAYTELHGIPPGLVAGAFVEDGGGTLWIGLVHGGILRRRGGRFERVPQDEITRGVSAAHRADNGDLWIGSTGDGVVQVMDATGERPRFRRYTTAEGLASNNVRSVTSDRLGRVYVGTARGVDRLDPVGGRVRHYTTADGLANGFVTASFRDRTGSLWFGTMRGLSRFVPQPDAPRPPPPVWVSRVQVDGVPRPVAHLGQDLVGPLEIAPGESQVHIEFFGLGFAVAEALRYQYRLDGVDRDWSPPAESREVHYVRLPPGSYRFQVRAVSADGVASPQPARLDFIVHPPFWRRGWFQAAVLLSLMVAGYAVHRHRLAQALAVERVRTRIASDLHDDIGSTVSRVAILSEVAKRQVADTHADAARVLDEIGASARELLDTTGDIVWAIDPRRDDGASLAARVREFGAGLLEPRGMAWTFEASPEVEALVFDPEHRRELLLVFKEALHNVVRHSHGTAASVRMDTRDGHLRAEIRDDGRGFAAAPDGAGGGHGLGNMKARAARLGGELRIDSRPGAGTVLTVDVPLP